MLRVELLEVGPFIGKIPLRVNGTHGTNRDACSAIDAFDRIDEQLGGRLKPRLITFWMNAVYRACINTRGVLNANAGLGYDKRHVDLRMRSLDGPDRGRLVNVFVVVSFMRHNRNLCEIGAQRWRLGRPLQAGGAPGVVACDFSILQGPN